MLVPKLRFPDYSGDWKKSTIGESGEFYYGRSCPKWSVTNDATIPCIRYGELYTKFENKIDKVYSYTSIEPANLRFSKGTEVLVPRVGEDPMDYTHCAWLSLPNVAIGEMISVYNTDNNPLFTALMFNAKLRTEFAKRVEGGSVTNLYYEKLRNIVIYYPTDLEEQQKIADFLSTVDEVIAQSEAEVQNLEQQKKAAMQKIFSQEVRFKREDGTEYPAWEEKRLHQLVIPNDKIPVDTSKYRKITIGLRLKGVSFTETTREMADKRPFYLRKEGEIIVGKQNYFNGSIALITKEFNNTICSNAIMSFMPNDSVITLFLLSAISNNKYLKEREYMANGTGQKELSEKDFLNFSVSIPCLEEQQKIADFLSAYDEAISYAKQELEHWKQLKKGLLQQMFV